MKTEVSEHRSGPADRTGFVQHVRRENEHRQHDQGAIVAHGASAVRRGRQWCAAGPGIAVENARLHERAAAAANRDSLTGLFNRRLLDDTIDQRLAEAERGQRPLSVILLDLDHFSRVNNAYGHLVGDEVLRRVADVLREAVRQSDVPVRFGGEEFVVLAPDTASPVRSTSRSGSGAGWRAWARSRSMGTPSASPSPPVLPPCGGKGMQWADLLRAADAALLAAKRGGRDRTMLSTDLRPATDPAVTQP